MEGHHKKPVSESIYTLCDVTKGMKFIVFFSMFHCIHCNSKIQKIE